MKKNVKLVLLLGALCLTACAKEPVVPGNNPVTTPTQEAEAPQVTMTACATEAPEITDMPEETKAPEITEMPEVKEETVPVRIYMENKEIVKREEERQVYAVIWQNPLIGGEDEAKYPAVSTVFKSLRTMRNQNAETVATDLAGVAEELKQYADEIDVSCYDSTRYYVQRADNHIISMRCNQSVSTGSIHPMSVVSGFNFSTETGDVLSLSDVVTDPGKIREKVKQELVEKYADCMFEEWETLYQEIETDDLAWTLDYDGLTFYFSPYMLSYYAAGVLTAEVDFAEEPALFRSVYTAAPEQGNASAVSLHSYMELGGANGTKDTFWVGQFKEDEDDYRLKLEIEKNGEYILGYDVYAYEYKVYLVTVEDKYYLFAEATNDNEYQILYIFDLSEEFITDPIVQMNAGFAKAGIDAEDYSYVEEVFNNPAEIRLSSRIDVFGTMRGTRSYSFDAKTGTLIPQTDIYTLNESMAPLISKIPLEVTMVGDNTKGTVPAGTEFTFLRSDGDTYAEFRLPDGRECRVTRDNGETWPYTVNGVTEEECFDGLGYAG